MFEQEPRHERSSPSYIVEHALSVAGRLCRVGPAKSRIDNLGTLPASYQGEQGASTCPDCSTSYARLDLYPDHRYALARLQQDEQGVRRTLDLGRWQVDEATDALVLSPEDDPQEDNRLMRWRLQDADTRVSMRRESRRRRHCPGRSGANRRRWTRRWPTATGN